MSTKLLGYKWTNANARSWHDGKFGPWAIGSTLRREAEDNGAACGTGIHIAITPGAAISYGKFPGRLFRVEGIGKVYGRDESKFRVSRARVIAELEKPSWVIETERFLESIKTVRFFRPGKHKPQLAWRHHHTGAAARAAAGAAAVDAARDAAVDAAGAAARAAAWDAAWDAARAAAWDAAGAAAWDAAWDAAWAAAVDAAGAAAWDAARNAAWAAAGAAYYCVVSDLDFPNKSQHAALIASRWEVWQMGYGLVGDVNGALYTYDRAEA